MGDAPDLAAATARLAHNATFVGILPALLVGVVLALIVHPIVGIVAAVGLAAAWVLLVRARLAGASEAVVAGLGASPLVPGDAPRFENLLAGLCLSSGVATPTTWVLDRPTMNALVCSSEHRIDIVVTRGLLEGLDRLELEGVIANLLGRVRDGSAGYITTVTALLGDSGRSRSMSSSALGDQWLVRSDLAAVDLTRYPPGLRSALDRMVAAGTAVDGAPERTSRLWIAPCGAAQGDDEPPLSLRIAVLSEL